VNSRLGFVYRTTIPPTSDIDGGRKVGIRDSPGYWREHLGLRLVDDKMRDLVNEDHSAYESLAEPDWRGIHGG
jgi:hypothetical protein